LEKFNNADLGGQKAHAFKRLFDGFQHDGLVSVLGLVSSQSGKKVARTMFVSDYDPGLGFTALSALVVAGTILHKRDVLGDKGRGFETAVVGCGPDLLKERYALADVRIETVVVDA
jgi:hypothetical protein